MNLFKGLSGRKVRCSTCGKPLKKHKRDALYSVTGDAWLGTVCTHCGLVFCEECLDAGGREPCPKCGQQISPASERTLPGTV